MAIETDSGANWYVLQVMSGRENKVFDKLDFECSRDAGNVVLGPGEEKQKFHSVFRGLVYGIYELTIPYERIEERKNSKKVVREQKLYPGYVLIRMKLFDEEGKVLHENIRFVKDTPNVIGMIGGQMPVPLTDEEAFGMMKVHSEAEEGKSKPKVQYNVGETVIIREGAFENCEGQIESVDEERCSLKVSVSIFGRYIPVEVEYGQVERPS